MGKSPGRPINPNSARQTKPWLKYGLSKAAYQYKKKYGDLPRIARVYHPRKLTAEQVQTIKRIACDLNGYAWVPLIAAEYGVSETTIHNIINERTHKDIPLMMLTPYSF